MAWKGSTTASAGTATEVSARNLQSPQKQRDAETAGAERTQDEERKKEKGDKGIEMALKQSAL